MQWGGIPSRLIGVGRDSIPPYHPSGIYRWKNGGMESRPTTPRAYPSARSFVKTSEHFFGAAPCSSKISSVFVASLFSHGAGM